MSGGPKGAKRPLGRPLDGGVRLPRPVDEKQTAVRDTPALRFLLFEPLHGGQVCFSGCLQATLVAESTNYGTAEAECLAVCLQGPAGALTANGRAATARLAPRSPRQQPEGEQSAEGRAAPPIEPINSPASLGKQILAFLFKGSDDEAEARLTAEPRFELALETTRSLLADDLEFGLRGT